MMTSPDETRHKTINNRSSCGLLHHITSWKRSPIFQIQRQLLSKQIQYQTSHSDGLFMHEVSRKSAIMFDTKFKYFNRESHLITVVLINPLTQALGILLNYTVSSSSLSLLALQGRQEMSCSVKLQSGDFQFHGDFDRVVDSEGSSEHFHRDNTN